MARALGLIAALLVVAIPLAGDAVYQAAPEGRELLVQQDAIVIHQDSDIIVYKHFDLPDHRVERVRLNQGSLPYSVVASSAAGRARIVGLWKRFGYTATVTDLAGKATRVFDAYIDYYPPGGEGSLLEVIPAATSFPIQLEGGGADLVAFSDISSIEFQGGRIRLTLRDGRTEQGTYLMPTTQSAEARFLGITDHYNPESPDTFDFSLPLSRIREIKFQ